MTEIGSCGIIILHKYKERKRKKEKKGGQDKQRYPELCVFGLPVSGVFLSALTETWTGAGFFRVSDWRSKFVFQIGGVKMKKFVAILIVLGLASMAQAAIFSESFDVDDAGWFYDGTVNHYATGGQSGGYVDQVRGNGHSIGWICPTRDSILNVFASSADWNANFKVGSETRIAFEYYLNPTAEMSGGKVYVYASAGGRWGLNLPALPVDTWTQVSYTVDTDWTDAQAVAAGWYQVDGTTSFPDTVRDVVYFSVVNGDAPGGACGLDTFSAATVPEPVTFGVLAIGALATLLRRKRR